MVNTCYHPKKQKARQYQPSALKERQILAPGAAQRNPG